MTAHLHHPPRLSGVPASQNTAPVAEFRCLFTHDVRRKQKRWQDGYLKFHSFNSRVMLYDTSRNYVGDTYWKEPNSLQEGDELTLDKGVMVEVADAVGVSQTDLTPLFEKSKKPDHAQSVPETRKQPVPPASHPPKTISHMRHKSLSTLLGTPKGPIGKATPIKSPYELRNEREKENELAANRIAKRQKTAHHQVHMQTAASRPVVNITLKSKEHAVYSSRTSRQMPAATTGAPSQAATPIALDYTSSDTLLSSPVSKTRIVNMQPFSKTTVPPQRLMVNKVSIATPPKIPKGRIRIPRAGPMETPQPPPRSSSPPVSASNRLSNVDFALQPIKKRQKEKERSPTGSPQRDPRAKSLRLSTGVKRKMLVCESFSPPAKPPRKRAEAAPAKAGHAKRAEKVRTGKRSRGLETSTFGEAREANHPLSSSLPRVEDIDVIHGLMDQMMVPQESPQERPEGKGKSPPALDPRLKERTKVTNAQPNENDVEERTIGCTAALVYKSKESASRLKQRSPPISDPLDTEVRDFGDVRSEAITIPDSPVSERSRPPSLFDQPYPARVHGAAPAGPSRNSLSPTKSKPAVPFSTGGIRKRSKKNDSLPRNGLQAKHCAKEKQCGNQGRPASLQREPSSPSHLLFTGEGIAAGPMNPGVPTKFSPTIDHIEDGNAVVDMRNPTDSGSAPIKKSPFRRVKSANDANAPEPPIRSTSGDWERRNMPPPPPPLQPAQAPPLVENPNVSHQQAAKSTRSGLAELVKKTDPRRKFLRTKSLNLDTGVGSTGSADDLQLPSPVIDHDVGPWSTEAFELLGWKPEGR